MLFRWPYCELRGDPPGKDVDVSDPFDVAVHDADELAEIEMLTNLIVASSEHEGRLPQRQIDEILGVVDPSDDAPAI